VRSSADGRDSIRSTGARRCHSVRHGNFEMKPLSRHVDDSARLLTGAEG
jgi:hypothetical protein